MLIDANAYLGHFAFRRLRFNTPSGLLQLMDEKGIQKAMVSSASAITYRNPQAGNEELFEQVNEHRDRLIPFAVINPSYAGWEDDIRICHEQLRMKGIRIYPNWHNYKLNDPCSLELIEVCSELGLPVSIPIRVEDYRQRSWLVDVPDLSLEEIAEVVQQAPKTRFILLNGTNFINSPLGEKKSDRPINYWIEISRLSALITNEIGELLSRLGTDHIIFGTGIPFKYPDPALLKLEVLELTEEEKEKIAWRNALKLLADENGGPDNGV